MADETGTDAADRLQRRTVLAGTAGIAGLLAGCAQSGGGNPDEDTEEEEADADTPEDTETSTRTPTATAPEIPESVPMGSILPLTGALGPYGHGMLKAVEIAVKDVNDAGGIHGAPIDFHPRDSETRPQAALQKYNSLASNENIVGFVGAASSRVSVPLAQNVADEGVMQVSNASTTPVLASLGYREVGGEQLKFVARTAPNDGQQGLVMGRVMNEQIGADSAAFLYVANPYGKAIAEKADAAFDGTTLSRIAFSKRTEDYGPILDKLHQDGPDAIGFVGYPLSAEPILQQWADGDYATEAGDWVLSEGVNSTEFLRTNADVVSGMWLTSSNPERTKGSETFQRKIGDANTLFAAHAYDAMFLQALAMERAGEVSGPAIARNIRAVSRGGGDVTVTVGEFDAAKAALENGDSIDYQGASSPVDLTRNLEPLNPYRILRIRSDGTRKTVGTVPRDWFRGRL